MSTRTVALPTGTWARVQPYIAVQELPKHLANVLPFLLGTVLAWWHGGVIDWSIFAVSLVALYFLTNGTYIANEFFDYEADRANGSRIGGADHVGVATTGGTRVLVNGLMPRRHALYMAVASFVLAVPLGLYLRYVLGTGPLTLLLGALAMFVGWFYTAPPVRACYRGLGEAFIAVAQGLVVFGAFYVQQGAHALPLLVPLAWFIALPALKIAREFPDFEGDAATGKHGLTVLFGRERMARVYAVLIALALLALLPVAGVIRGLPFLLVLLPAAFLARSMLIMGRGEWREPARLEVAAVSGFIGMLLIPMSLAAAFVLDAMLR
jgi:1,4-dihydroxy-2-naphthoate polyprenyltransferase